MTSINFSASASSAIRALQAVNRELDITQNRISTGLKISSAKDGASAWQAASTLRSEIKGYEAASDAMDYTKSALNVAASGAEMVADILSDIKSVVANGVNAPAGVARDKADADLLALQSQLKSVIADAQFQGLNLLNTATKQNVVTGYSASGATTVVEITPENLNSKLDADTANLGASSDYFNFTIAGVITLDKLSDTMAALDTAITTATTEAATFGAASARIDSTQAMLKKLSDIKQTGLSSLVEADMEEESAKLSALQIKQQLATQALSIANSSASNVLRLFQ